jgi:phenylalanyl-tRNA synthetase alpha chain
MFSQVEGLCVGEGITFGDLKGTLLHFARSYFGEGFGVRLRPSFFPFTEPSAEIDFTCAFCAGKGCRVCKGSGWIEIGGSGMVDPVVFQNVGIDPEKYTGFAFGWGIDRMAMLKYKINDIKLLFEGDVRFARQFR